MYVCVHMCARVHTHTQALLCLFSLSFICLTYQVLETGMALPHLLVIKMKRDKNDSFPLDGAFASHRQ